MSKQNQIDYLNNLLRQIEKNKEKRTSSKTKLDLVLEKLKAKFEINSTDEAERFVHNKKREIEKLDRKLSSLVEELEDLYEWD